MQNIDKYQEWTESTAIYDDPLYPILGLTEEAGEVAGKYAKYIRDHTSLNGLKHDMTKELGDVLWMIARISSDMGVQMSEIVEQNIVKLESRKKRDKLEGSGDDR